MKRTKRTPLTVIMVLAIIFVFSAVTTIASVWPQPGSTSLSKTAAKVSGTSNQWDITLQVQGMNLPGPTTDCVVVIDRSGSMSGTGMVQVKAAATTLVNSMLASSNSNVKIAVVTYSADVTKLSGGAFYGYSQKSDLVSLIGTIPTNTSGSTNIQLGIKTGRDLLANSTAERKMMVVLSDGAPNYSYKATSVEQNYTGFSSVTGVTAHNFRLFNFNYSTRLGDGRNYALSSGSQYTVGSPSVTVSDNGIGTISEAALAKAENITLYSVGYNVTSDNKAQYVMRNIASAADKFFNTGDSNLSDVFGEIAGQVVYAARDAVVEDVMGDMFNLYLGDNGTFDPSDFTVSQGTVSLTQANKIRWEIGNIREGTPATITYRVTIKDEAQSEVLYPTNKWAKLTYYDGTNTLITKEFDKPQVSIQKGAITTHGYLVNENGQPINAAGQVVSNISNAYRLYDGNYTEGNSAALSLPGNYTVTAQPVSGYEVAPGTESTKQVAINASAPNGQVWFAYIVAREPASVTVKYVEKGNPSNVLDTAALTGKVGDSYTVEQKSFTGFSYDSISNPNGSNVFLSSNQDITVYYTRNNYDYTVHYFVDGTENTSWSYTRQAPYASQATYDDKRPTGYKLGSTNAPITIATSGNVINVYYVKDSFDYTVHYFLDGVEDTSRGYTRKAEFGSQVTYDPQTIKGYQFVSSNAPITMGTTGNVINVYYEAEDYDYTVHYFLDGVEDITLGYIRSAPYGSQVSTYEDRMPDGYKFDRATTPITIDVANNVINVYYVKNTFGYTVRYFIDGVENTSYSYTDTATFGSQISTYTDKRPTGYKLGSTNAPITIGTGTNEIRVYYVKDSFSYTVRYFIDGTENTSLSYSGTAVFGSQVSTYTNKCPTGYKLDHDTAPITIATTGNVIKVYYVKQTYSYTVRYYFDGVEDTSSNYRYTSNALFGSEISTYVEYPVTGYSIDRDTAPITIGTGTNEIKVYYVKNSYSYTVHYFKDGVEDTSLRYSDTALFGSQVTYADKTIKGYKFHSTNAPITIGVSGNDVNVYYVKDSFAYTVHYFKDGVEDTSLRYSGTALYGSQVTYTEKTIKGYKFHSTNAPVTIDVSGNDVNVYYVKDTFEYTVHYFKDGVEDTSLGYSGTALYGTQVTYTEKTIRGYRFDSSNAPITIDVSDNVINVYFVKNNFSYEVHYYLDGVEEQSLAYMGSALYASEVNSYTDKRPTGYKLDYDTAPITIDISGNRINVYYVKDSFEYAVRYYIDGEEVSQLGYTDTALFGTKIETYEDKMPTGYKLDRDTAPITVGVKDNAIEIYYVKDTFDYTVRYYIDEEENTAMGYTDKALFGTIVSGYTDKTPKGYELDRDTAPITIGVEDNEIKVYYAKARFDYAVRYYLDGVEDTSMGYLSSALYGTVIDTVTDKLPEGYVLDRMTGLPLTISTSGNTVSVFYASVEDISEGSTPTSPGTGDDVPWMAMAGFTLVSSLGLLIGYLLSLKGRKKK